MNVKRDANLDKRKVVLGLSGGVDSTAAALLLKEKGFAVIGLYFNIHRSDNIRELDGVKKAKKIAEELDIKLHIADLNETFNDFVVNYFMDEYLSGKTPNPCIMCNPNIKFKALIDVANRENAYYIATGHYAETVNSDIQGCYTIKTGENKNKDQSYMLYRLPQKYIDRIIFPLGQVADKNNTRKFVRDNSLSNADDKDSQEICFIPNDIDYGEFINKRKNRKSIEGMFIDKDGNVLGRHKGIEHYTIGQRKGLGIALGKPAFVVDIDAKNDTVIIGDNRELFKSTITIDDCYFHSTDSCEIPNFIKNKSIYCKIRYKAPMAKCNIKKLDGKKAVIIFEEPQRAPAPGQSAVIYVEDEIVGGGFICK